ncbi:MAG: hypothetical protein Q8N59_00805 [bacterium]|nr:hypothetical protein [bacterium]
MKSLKTVLIVFALLVVSLLVSVCGTITGPDPPPPPPPPEKTYTLQVQYIRTFLNPETSTLTPFLSLFDLSGSRSSIPLNKIDDPPFHFNGELAGVKVRADYYFQCYDGGRYDGSDVSSSMVGDIFIVTVKETGFTAELKDIRPYNLPTNPNPGPKAKAAFLQLTAEGTIISNAQSSNR